MSDSELTKSVKELKKIIDSDTPVSYNCSSFVYLTAASRKEHGNGAGRPHISSTFASHCGRIACEF